jgi:hypothetical protein
MAGLWAVRGTLFSIKAGGVEAVLHSFGDDNDGAIPPGGVIDIGGVLYGTTQVGGSGCEGGGGCGAVFALRP